MAERSPHIVLTSGEPAGIGPDLVVSIAQEAWPFRLTVLGDPEVLLSRARLLRLPLRLKEGAATGPHIPGELHLIPLKTEVPVEPGKLDPQNGPYVVAMIERAVSGCLEGRFDAVVTAPVHKETINRAGIFFPGHTEFIASLSGGHPVMLLVAETVHGPLRIALATTHLPLKVVHRAVVSSLIVEKTRILVEGLRNRFGVDRPRIAILGLNPHAGEGGFLGREEIEEIIPAIRELQEGGNRVEGPMAADTAFLPWRIERYDAYLAMYHDQGLPVLKALGFGRAANVTLGIPIVRTSVDHGTALQLAGTGTAEAESLKFALRLSADLVTGDVPSKSQKGNQQV